MQTMGKITKKSEDEIFWTFLSKFDKFRQKMPFLQKCDLFKTTFCVITCARIKLEAWNLVNGCRKKSQKFHKKLNFEFSIIFNFIEFLWGFLGKKSLKLQQNKTSMQWTPGSQVYLNIKKTFYGQNDFWTKTNKKNA